jgi:hypothetical protein
MDFHVQRCRVAFSSGVFNLFLLLLQLETVRPVTLSQQLNAFTALSEKIPKEGAITARDVPALVGLMNL